MATDDERREVARRLRSVAREVDRGGFSETIKHVKLAVFEDLDRYRPNGTLDRLADLIEPPYPDATASYKGWRAEVYDPDGALASPSNAAADLVRAHADGKAPSEQKVRCVAEVKVDGERLEQLAHDAVVEVIGIDRDALLALADEIEDNDVTYCVSEQYVLNSYADRIREALGVES